jgi:hypothetical protein
VRQSPKAQSRHQNLIVQRKGRNHSCRRCATSRPGTEEDGRYSTNSRTYYQAQKDGEHIAVPFLHSIYEENIPLSSLDADPRSVLDCPATMRAIFIHSYSDYRIDLANTKLYPRRLLTCIRMTNYRLVQTGSIFRRLYLLHS